MISYLFDEEYQRKMYDEAMRAEYMEEFKEEIAKERDAGRAEGIASTLESMINNMRRAGIPEEQIKQITSFAQ